RNTSRSLQTGEYEAGITSSDQVFAFSRFVEPTTGNPVVIIANLGDQEVTTNVEFSKRMVSRPWFQTQEDGYSLYDVFGDPNAFILGRETGADTWMIENLTLEPGEVLTLGFNVLLSNEEKAIPASLELAQNYPNPFNPSTTISFTLPQATQATLSVYDVTGRLVEVLINEHRSSGQHRVTFDASRLASGMYFYRLEAGEQVKTQKMMLIK
ncbi:MAG: T9SS type A sorting domain-containing protein, partial [Bacteroidota bacterium]